MPADEQEHEERGEDEDEEDNVAEHRELILLLSWPRAFRRRWADYLLRTVTGPVGWVTQTFG